MANSVFVAWLPKLGWIEKYSEVGHKLGSINGIGDVTWTPRPLERSLKEHDTGTPILRLFQNIVGLNCHIDTYTHSHSIGHGYFCTLEHPCNTGHGHQSIKKGSLVPCKSNPDNIEGI